MYVMAVFFVVFMNSISRFSFFMWLLCSANKVLRYSIVQKYHILYALCRHILMLCFMFFLCFSVLFFQLFIAYIRLLHLIFLWILPDIFVFYKSIFILKWAFSVSNEVIFLCLYASFMWIFMNCNSCFQRIIALFYLQNIVFIAIFPAQFQYSIALKYVV